MNIKEAIQFMNSSQNALEYMDAHFTADSAGGYICPLCDSGSGANGTGISHYTDKEGIERFTCWACHSYENSSVVDVIAIRDKVEGSDIDKIKHACQEFGIELENNQGNQYQKQTKNAQNKNNDKSTKKEEPKMDYTSFFLEANRHIEETTYHRGLTLETLNHFKIGYVEKWKHPKDGQSILTPRLIIPTSKYTYVARRTDGKSGKKWQEEAKLCVGERHLLNPKALKEATKPIWIVEGELDALSIIDVGGEAVGLGGTGGYKKLLALVKEEAPNQRLIIMMDNDEAGQKGNTDLIKGLNDLGIKYSFFYNEPLAGHKDANEYLTSDREGFSNSIRKYTNKAIDEEKRDKEADIAELKKSSVASHLAGFLKNIKESENTPYFSTGFKDLDKILDGGLFAGLYIVGAISSLGKTTFCIQVADAIAKQGQDVLIFSLEMAEKEIISKSVSRNTLLLDLEKYNTTIHAKTTKGILTGAWYKNYSQEELEIINEAVNKHYEYADHIYITEGVGDVGINEITAKVKSHMEITGKAPVVLIDYLQVLAPIDEHMTDKQNTDKAVLELKRLSRDYDIPVIGISSFNRQSYTDPVNMSSFKESGAIEYTSDVLLALQFDGMDYVEGESDPARKKRIRELIKTNEQRGRRGNSEDVQVKVLKNRNGSKGEAILKFFPKFNYFTSDEFIDIDYIVEQTIGSPEEDDELDKWKEPVSNYGKTKKEDPRAEKRATLQETFELVKDERGEAKLVDFADLMGKSQKQVKNMINDLELYEIDGKIVREKKPEAEATEDKEE